jgi:outer membrane protein assembly factor BamD (BamD/ComL family)
MKLMSGAILLVFVTASRAIPQGQVGNVQPKSDTALLNAGTELMKNNKVAEAQLAFQTSIRLYPESPLQPAAYFALGESFQSLQGKENLLLAEDQFRNFVIFFPQNTKAPDAQLKIISILMRESKMSTEARGAKRALFEISKFLTLFPTNDFSAIAIQYRQEMVSKLMEMGTPISGHIQESGGKPVPNVKITAFDRASNSVIAAASSDTSMDRKDKLPSPSAAPPCIKGPLSDMETAYSW